MEKFDRVFDGDDITRKIHDAIAAGHSQYAMQTFDQSIFDLHQRELITYEEAIQSCTNPDDFTLKVKGIQSTSDVAWEESEAKKDAGGGSSDFKIERF